MKRLFVIVIIVLFSVLFVMADESEVIELDLDTSIALSLSNNLDIETEQLKFDKTRWAMITSWNKFLPSATMKSDLARPNMVQEPPLYVIKENTDNQWSLNASISTSLSLSASKVFNVYQTVIDWQTGKISLQTANEKMKLDVTKKYYDILVQQDELQIKKDELASAEERYQQTRIQYLNGLKSEYDTLSAQVQFENIKPGFIDFVNSYNIALYEFKEMLGLKENAPIKVTGQIQLEMDRLYAEEDIPSLQQRIDDRLDIRQNLFSLKSKQNSRNINIANLTPSFSISYGVGPSFQGNAIDKNWFGDASYMDENWEEGSFAGFSASGLTLSLSMPLDALFPFSSKQMSLINSQYDIKIQQLSNQKSIDSARLEIRKLVMQLIKSRKSLESLELNLKLAKKAYDMADEQYKAGNMDLLSVNGSEDEWKKAKLTLLKERKSYITGALDLEYAMEVGSPGGISAGAGLDISAGAAGFDMSSIPAGMDLSAYGF